MNLDHLLLLGSRGADVTALQQKLNSLGPAARLSADGRFGMQTHAAVKAFQQRHGLKPDGVVGPRTAKALGWTYAIAAAPLPIFVSASKPPVPASTPPLLVVHAAIEAGLVHYFSLLKKRVAESGASAPVIVQSTMKLQQLLHLQCEQVRRVLSSERPDMLSITGLMGVGFEGGSAIDQIKREITQSGGDYHAFFLLEHTRHTLLMQLGPIVQQLMYGNEAAATTIAKIRELFVREYGNY